MASLSSRTRNAIFRVTGSAHSSLYRATNGRFGGKMYGAPLLLLNTTGRKSGERRTTPLMYLRDGENLVLTASNGGAPRDPAWYLNLEASPEATAELGDRKIRVRAEVANPEEKARLWPRLVEMFSGYEDYQKKTEREFPVVVLHPVGREP